MTVLFYLYCSAYIVNEIVMQSLFTDSSSYIFGLPLQRPLLSVAVPPHLVTRALKLGALL